MFGIFLDFYSSYFWFFYRSGTVHTCFELSEFICWFWPIYKSIFGVLYIKMFIISWAIYWPNLVILRVLFLFLKSVLVKNRKAVRKPKTVKPYLLKTEIQKFIEIHRKLQKWKTNYANAQDDIVYMTVQRVSSDSFSKYIFWYLFYFGYI